ncbi:hypothetical protein Sjap_026528 [Stephania japonica]|uniref:Uncharacterized protein n=1 Tax=Stephania japonica TaxID=461633 RepID=A0AAP0E875_9MAGN
MVGNGTGTTGTPGTGSLGSVGNGNNIGGPKNIGICNHFASTFASDFAILFSSGPVGFASTGLSVPAVDATGSTTSSRIIRGDVAADSGFSGRRRDPMHEEAALMINKTSNSMVIDELIRDEPNDFLSTRTILTPTPKYLASGPRGPSGKSEKASEV